MPIASSKQSKVVAVNKFLSEREGGGAIILEGLQILWQQQGTYTTIICTAIPYIAQQHSTK